MLYKYDYETINGRECMIGWQGWNNDRLPVPGADKDKYVKMPPPEPEEMVDEWGNHRFVEAHGGYALSPAVPNAVLAAEKEKSDKVEKMKEALAKAMIENNFTLDDFVKAIKDRKEAVKL